MAEEKSVDQPWTYTHVHGGDHPDNKEPVTLVATASDEAVEKEEAAMNAAYAAAHVEAPPGPQPLAGEPKPEQQNLDDKTVVELKEIAEQKGIHVPWDANKADIIKVIKKAK
jgi:hypothetical protein